MKTAIAAVLTLLGLPLFATAALSAILYYRDTSLESVILNFYELSQKPLLTSLPLFAFGGYLLARSRAPVRLVELANALVGSLPGGLAIVSVIACALVTAITGASGVTIIALGGLLLPALLANGYKENFSVGLLTTGGSLGMLFPPSLPVILFGVISETPVDELFVAGILPGLVILILVSLYAVRGTQHGRAPRTPFSWSRLRRATIGAIWEVPIPLGVVGGIFSGFFTVSEAAVVTTTYIVILTTLIRRDIRFAELLTIARDSMVLIGGILMILGMTMAVNNAIIDEEIPQRLFEWAQGYMTHRHTFLITLNVFLLLVGCMIDIYAATVLLVPLIVPLAQNYGVDMRHLGIIFLANLGIGYVTPPVGLNLFIASVRFKRPILQIYWATLPFIAILLVALAIITFVPGLSLWLLD
ncbi:MAG: TRAP transporter large permease [Planctomycetota bacterium]